MFGDGLIHVRFVSSNHIERRQPSILITRRSAPIFRCLLKSWANSPIVRPCRSRDRVIRDERELVAIRDRTFDVDAADRIRTIQNKHRKLHLRRFFHQVTERGNVGVETRADVLNVEHERVEIFELLGLWPARLAVQRIDWKPGLSSFESETFSSASRECHVRARRARRV